MPSDIDRVLETQTDEKNAHQGAETHIDESTQNSSKAEGMTTLEEVRKLNTMNNMKEYNEHDQLQSVCDKERK